MDTAGLLPVFTLVLLFQAVFSRESSSLFFSGGQDALLPCANASPADTACSFVSWFYSTDQYYFTVVANGNVVSRFASRLSLDATCSLLIKNITAEDVGVFTCRRSWNVNLDETMFINVLTISPSPPGADPKRDGEVTLACSLRRFTGLTCARRSLRWADQTGAELPDEGVGHRVLRQTNCVSFLTVKRLSGLSRTYGCRFVEANRVAAEAEYTPDFTDDPVDHTITIIIVVTVIAIGVVLVVTAAVVIRYRKRAKVTEDVPKLTRQPDEPESHLTYVTYVGHARQHAPLYINVKEEEVTYATVNTLARTEADNDPSSLYSCVSKPKINQRK